MNANAEFLAVWEANEAAMQQARSMYPHNPALQAEWVRAINTVRSTARGYLLDKPVQRLQEPQQ